MPALERLLRNLYGSQPQIDLDKKIARSRVIEPRTLDFRALGDGMKRANVDLMAIQLEVTAEVKGGKAVLRPTGQELPLEGLDPADGSARRRTFRVFDWMDRGKTRVRPVE
jgi:hypothetical protein